MRVRGERRLNRARSRIVCKVELELRILDRSGIRSLDRSGSRGGIRSLDRSGSRSGIRSIDPVSRHVDEVGHQLLVNTQLPLPITAPLLHLRCCIHLLLHLLVRLLLPRLFLPTLLLLHPLLLPNVESFYDPVAPTPHTPTSLLR